PRTRRAINTNSTSAFSLLTFVLRRVAQSFPGRGDPFHDRQFVCWRKVTIPGGHGDRLVTRRLLNLLDHGAGHRKPRSQGVPIAVPNVLADPRLFQAGFKPRPRVELSLAPLERIVKYTSHYSTRLRGENQEAPCATLTTY